MFKNIKITTTIITFLSILLSFILVSKNQFIVKTQEQALINWTELDDNIKKNNKNLEEMISQINPTSIVNYQMQVNLPSNEDSHIVSYETQKIENEIKRRNLTEEKANVYLRQNYSDFALYYDEEINSKSSSRMMMPDNYGEEINSKSSSRMMMMPDNYGGGYLTDISVIRNETIVKNIKTAIITFNSIALAASIASAGFFIANFFTKVPTFTWGIECARIAATSVLCSASLKLVLVAYDKELNKWLKAESTFFSTFTIAHYFAKMALLNLNATSEILITKSLWLSAVILPAISSLSGIIEYLMNI